MVIREAKGEDIPRILEMAARFIHETSYREQVAENPEQMAHTLAFAMQRDKGRVLVAEQDGRLSGMLIFLLFPHYVSGEKIAGELVWWVEPEFRYGKAALLLLKEAKKMATELGAVKMQMVAPVTAPKVGQMYAKLGYTAIETSYQMDLRGAP